MDFEDNRSNDENTKIPIQDRVGENNTAIPEERKPRGRKNPTIQRKKKPSLTERYGLPYNFDIAIEENVKEPKSYNEAVNSPQAEDWKKGHASRVRLTNEQQHSDISQRNQRVSKFCLENGCIK